MKDEKKLTIKQQRFVNEYVKDGNGARAVLDAGYNVTDRNVKVASEIASENLEKPGIKAKVEEALAVLNLTPEYTLNGFKKIADSSRVDMAKARALENIATIQDLYPRHNNSLELGDGKLSIKWED